MLKKLALLLSLLAPVVSFGQGVIVPPQTALKSVNGVTMPIANATITVCAVSTGGLPCSPALANALFVDAALTVPLPNPFTADANGNYNFAIAPGNYTVTVTAQGFSGYSYQVSAGNGTAGSSVTLQTNGVNNSVQSLLNLVPGSGIGIANSGGNDTFTNNGVVSFNARTGAVVPVTNDYNWAQIASGSNLNTQTMGSGGNLSPLNAGQVAASQYWLPPGIPVPSTTGTNTGGSINNAHAWLIQISFNTAAGETLPSDLLSGNTTTLTGGVCVSGGCTLTVVAPSLTGYLSYNVYACDTNGSICTSAQKVAACTAITTNCTFTAPYQTNTSGVLTVATAFVQPPNAQANNGFAGSIPGWFFQKVDGNYYPWLGIDIHDCDNTTGPPLPCGTPLITHRTFFSDLGGASAQYPNQYQSFKNAFISINHGAGVGTTLTNQDRALGLLMQNSATDTSTHFSMEGIQAEVDINNAPNITGSPDGEVAAFSGQVSDAHVGGQPNPTLGIWGARLTTTRQGGAGGGYSGCTAIPCMGGARIEMVGSSANSSNNGQFTSLFLRSQGNPSDGTRMSTLWIEPAATANRSGVSNKAIVVDGWFNGFTNAADLAFDFDWTSTSTPLKGMMQPVTFFGGGGFTGCGASACPAFASNILNGTGTAGVAGATTSLPIWGSLQPNGGVATNQLVAATVNTDFVCQVTGTTGTNYSYSVVAVDGTGFGTTPATSTCTASAAATLNGSNFVTINIKNQSGAIYGQGASRYDVYRTASAGVPASTGFLGSASCVQTQVALFIPGSVNICAFTDTGVAATGVVPTVNTTGAIATKGDYFFSRDKGQHFNAQAANNDLGGVATCAASTATVTFTRAYTSTPVIVVSDETAAGGARVSAKSASSFTITCTGATDVVDYIVVGNPN